MSLTARRIIASSTALAMLVLLAWPAYAVCGCEEPGGMPCCDPDSAPTEVVVVKIEAETSSCCSAEPEPAPAPETCSVVADADDMAFAPAGCEQDVISAELPTASLPTKTVSQDADGSIALSAAAAVASTSVTTHQTASRGHRAPPPRSVPAFLLNAAFII